jgi:L-asparaginase
MAKRRIALISTGGTVEKTYDELEGVLHNAFSVLDVMLASLLLEGVEIVRVPLMNKDSLHMTAEDHTLIAETAGAMTHGHDGVVILHGTDHLALSGERMVEVLGTPKVPIVLTGAIRPYVLRNSDAMQNMTEAFLAVQIVNPGVYVAIHNKVLRFPGVVKDRGHGTFCYADELVREDAC